MMFSLDVIFRRFQWTTKFDELSTDYNKSSHWRPRARFLRFGVFWRESLICMIYWSSSSLKLIYETKHMGGLNVA